MRKQEIAARFRGVFFFFQTLNRKSCKRFDEFRAIFTAPNPTTGEFQLTN